MPFLSVVEQVVNCGSGSGQSEMEKSQNLHIEDSWGRGKLRTKA